MPPTPPAPAPRPLPDTVLDLVDQLDVMAACWNADQVCVYANAAFARAFGRARPQVIGRTARELLGAQDEARGARIDAAYRGFAQTWDDELAGPRGAPRPVRIRLVPDLADGRVRGVFVQMTDLAPLKAAAAEVAAAEARAAHDAATGLPNPLLLRETLQRALAAAHRTGDSVAVMRVDIGPLAPAHAPSPTGGARDAASERLRVEVGRHLRQALRATDTLFPAPAGDDGFVAVLAALTAPAEAERVGRRVLAAAMAPVALPSGAAAPSVSIGIAHLARHGHTPEVLLAAAERARDEALARGRDRLVVLE